MSSRAGQQGEARAAALLPRRGYTILARNVRLGRGELDIVAQHDKLIVFVEVKAHRSHAAALQAMHPDKCARLRSAAESWLSRHPEYCDWPCRFDLIILTPGVGLAARFGPHIEQMEDIIR